MTPVPDLSYWERMSMTGRRALLLPWIPDYARHALLRPYRKTIHSARFPSFASRLQGRHAAAAIDAWIDRLLRAHRDVAGYRVNRESGRLAVYYIRLMAALNREYEHRLATAQPLRLGLLLENPIIAEHLAEWTRFATSHTTDGAVIEFMSCDDLVTDYDRYTAITTTRGFTTNPALQIASMRLDSGGYLARLIRLIDAFNGRRSTAHVDDEFVHLGMAAKFADELTDVATDHAEGRYNLLLALLSQHHDECAAAMSRLERALPMPVSWWIGHAPRSFGQFSAWFTGSYRSIRSARLRRICDATMIRALPGPKRRPSARPQQHVSEPPSRAWR